MGTFLIYVVLALIVLGVIGKVCSAFDNGKKESNEQNGNGGITIEGPKNPTYLSKVAGVTFDNEDGSSRQEALRLCKPGDELLLVRQPENVHDKNAIAIFTLQGHQIGYIPSDQRLAIHMDGGFKVNAEVVNVQKGDGGHLGCLIRLEKLWY